MNVYDFAMKMEKDGESYYRQLAAKTGSKGLKNIFLMLADAEVAHYEIFRKMKENGKARVARTKILSRVKNVFEKMREKEEDTDGDITQTALYKKAREVEKKSRDFYLQKASETADPVQKEVLLRVADEERKHYFILEEIIDFVSRPQTWLENPEWYHIEEY